MALYGVVSTLIRIISYTHVCDFKNKVLLIVFITDKQSCKKKKNVLNVIESRLVGEEFFKLFLKHAKPQSKPSLKGIYRFLSLKCEIYLGLASVSACY